MKFSLTIQTRIAVGTWQPDRDGARNSRVTIWAALEGQPQKVVIDHALYLRGPERFAPNSEYGKIWLLPFMTKKDPAEDHETGYVWYDELIVSTEFIADPK